MSSSDGNVPANKDNDMAPLLKWKKKQLWWRRYEERMAKVYRVITLVCLAIYLVICVIFLIMGRPILILASIVPVVVLSVLFHGPTLEDLVFLIWWDRGKGK